MTTTAPAAASGQFPFLDAAPADTASLCGRDAVQVRVGSKLDLATTASRLRSVGRVAATPFLVRVSPTDNDLRLTAFADGRIIVQGTADIATARSAVARYFGT